jgi:hypothetical protein
MGGRHRTRRLPCRGPRPGRECELAGHGTLTSVAGSFRWAL